MMNAGQVSQSSSLESGAHEHVRIRVALADDHPIVRYALRELLMPQEDIEVIGEWAISVDMIRVAKNANADILIAGLQQPHLSRLDVLRHAGPKPKIILLSASDDKNELIQALKLGCAGVVLKRSASEDILTCIRKVYAGGMWVDCTATTIIPNQLCHGKNENREVQIDSDLEQPFFSPREREILAMVAQGTANPGIAARLFVSPQTVKNHLHRMYSKLGVTDRHELVLYAIHEGIQRAPECNGSIHRVVRRRRVHSI